MTRVILNGCSGRMGQVLTDLIEAQEDMEVVAGIDIHTSERSYPIFSTLADCTLEADALIDFTSPVTLPLFLPEAQKRKLPAVIATTGMSPEDIRRIEEASRVIPIFRSANMSLGINLVQQLLKTATKVLGDRYDIEIFEKHHKLKKDAPSGTALMLADSINEVLVEKKDYVCGRSGSDSLRQKNELGLHSFRGGTIVGEHDVYFSGTDEMIRVGHIAYSRQVFATGAIAAARYLAGQKPGLYNMQDMINQSQAVSTLYTFPDEVLVNLNHFPDDMNAMAALYGDFASADVFIDMISHSGDSGGNLSLAFTVKTRDLDKTRKILDAAGNRYPGVESSIREAITRITVEGPGMEIQSGVAYRLFSCMAVEGIRILAVTTSEIKISCVTSDDQVEKAVGVIKREFQI